MSAYLVRRLLLAMPTLIGVSILVAAMVRFLPGDAVDAMADQYYGDLEALREELGLNKPFHEAYIDWVIGAVQGDFGTSLRDGVDVGQGVRDRFWVTLQLGVMAIVISVLVAVPVGVLSAAYQDTWFDQVARSFATLLTAVPYFWTGVLVLTWGSIWFAWSPPVTYQELWENPVQNLKQLILPALILGTSTTGTKMRITRTEMLEVIRQDYIRTARAKGLRGRVVILRHGLRNASLPIVTVVGLQLPILVGGVVIIEQLFVLPGMGRYMLNAINFRDYPVVQAVTMMIASMVVIANMLVDLTYGWLDPRVRLS
jgi:peptide/nickel transport system permease protein